MISVGSLPVREAGIITERYRLPAYAAVHLAAGLAVRARTEETVTFAYWDRALADVAVKAGFIYCRSSRSGGSLD